MGTHDTTWTARLLRSEVVDELVCLVYNLLLDQLLYHIFNGDDADGLSQLMPSSIL